VSAALHIMCQMMARHRFNGLAIFGLFWTSLDIFGYPYVISAD